MAKVQPTDQKGIPSFLAELPLEFFPRSCTENRLAGHLRSVRHNLRGCTPERYGTLGNAPGRCATQRVQEQLSTKKSPLEESREHLRVPLGGFCRFRAIAKRVSLGITYWKLKVELVALISSLYQGVFPACDTSRKQSFFCRIACGNQKTYSYFCLKLLYFDSHSLLLSFKNSTRSSRANTAAPWTLLNAPSPPLASPACQQLPALLKLPCHTRDIPHQ